MNIATISIVAVMGLESIAYTGNANYWNQKTQLIPDQSQNKSKTGKKCIKTRTKWFHINPKTWNTLLLKEKDSGQFLRKNSNGKYET